MSVLIKGLEMPMSCRQCSLYLQSMDSERNVYENCAVTAKSYNWGLTTRPSDCPLVPVQAHGRLIDADALKDVQQADADFFKGSSDYGEKCRYDEAINAVANIVNAPTIIPAEEGD